jgi:hypothetical protein
MPTRHERLANTTFVAKLSKHNVWRKRQTHAKYNELFRDKFAAVVGYKPAYNTATKKEWLAAVNWMAYYSTDRAKVEELDETDLATLRSMFQWQSECEPGGGASRS